MTHSVRHNTLHCSYRWHRSLKAESDRFLPVFFEVADWKSNFRSTNT